MLVIGCNFLLNENVYETAWSQQTAGGERFRPYSLTLDILVFLYTFFFQQGYYLTVRITLHTEMAPSVLVFKAKYFHVIVTVVTTCFGTHSMPDCSVSILMKTECRRESIRNETMPLYLNTFNVDYKEIVSKSKQKKNQVFLYHCVYLQWSSKDFCSTKFITIMWKI